MRLKHVLGRRIQIMCFSGGWEIGLKHGLGRGRAKMCFNDCGVGNGRGCVLYYIELTEFFIKFARFSEYYLLIQYFLWQKSRKESIVSVARPLRAMAR